MKVLSMLAVLIGLAMFTATQTHADEWDKMTQLTFTQPVQVPGKVLPAGTYVFRLYNSAANRHIVRIFQNDNKPPVTTVQAIASQQTEPAGTTVITYAERPSNEPVALDMWFYPGDKIGQQFVYPKSKAEQLSAMNHVKVPSTGTEEAYPGEGQNSQNNETAQNNTAAANPAPIPPPSGSATENNQPASNAPNPPRTEPVHPNLKANEQQPAPAEAQPERQSAAGEAQQQPAPAQTQPKSLPHTASYLPLAALVGFVLLGVAVVLRVAVHA